MNKSLIIILASGLFMGACTNSTPGSGTNTGNDNSQAVEFSKVKTVIEQKCSVCHSSTPSRDGVSAAPAGIMFDTDAQIKSRAERINQRAVVKKDMPPMNNITNISQEERDLIQNWVAAGAPLN